MKSFKLLAASMLFGSSPAMAGNVFSDKYGSWSKFGNEMMSQSDCTLVKTNNDTLSLVDDYQNRILPHKRLLYMVESSHMGVQKATLGFILYWGRIRKYQKLYTIGTSRGGMLEDSGSRFG